LVCACAAELATPAIAASAMAPPKARAVTDMGSPKLAVLLRVRQL